MPRACPVCPPPHPIRPGQHRQGVAVAICEVEAGLRSASQLERICPHSLWDAVPRPVRVPRPTAIQREQARPGWCRPGRRRASGSCGEVVC
jgi:hypothetical protein